VLLIVFQSIYNLITTSHGKLSAIYPALLAVINNIAAYIEALSGPTCSKILQLFNSMSSPSFLLANDTNHELLRSLMESMNSAVEHQYKSKSPAWSAQAVSGRTDLTRGVENPELVYAILRNRKRVEALRSFTLESGREEMERRNQRSKEAGRSVDPLEPTSTRSSVESLRSPTAAHSKLPPLGDVVEEDSTFAIGEDDDESDEDVRPTPSPSDPSERPSRSSSVASQVEDDVPRQLRGMSEKARGKLPAGAATFRRQNSTASLASNSGSSFSPSGGGFEPTSQWIDSWLPELPLHTMLALIQQLAALIPRQALVTDAPAPAIRNTIREARLVGVDPSPIRVHTFEWSPMALGWYESLLWGFIFSSEMQVAKGTVGIWNATAIKLFRVQETAPEGPTLTSPRGAVDAVGSNIVSRIGAMNLRGAAGGGTHAGPPAQAAQAPLGAGAPVRSG
jgi:hypothetical protein